MSSPLIWIILPFVASIPLWLLRKRGTIGLPVAAAICALLAIFALALPVGKTLSSLVIQDTLTMFGRKFVLGPNDQYLVVLIYTMGALWFFGAVTAHTPGYFAPLGLAILSLLLAALAVRPFLYAAVLVEIAVLLSIPMFVPPGSRAGKGVLRYLIFQTLGMPFILFSGWLLSGGINTSDTLMVTQATLLLGLGLMFWLAIFPFYTWIPLIADEVHPYIAGFMFNLLPVVAMFLMLAFLDNYAWLRNVTYLYPALQLTGALMVVTGGIWAAFQRNLNRILGYIVIAETGFLLLGVGLQSTLGLSLMVSALLPRAIVLSLAFLAVSLLQNTGIETTLEGTRGLLRTYPFISVGLLVAIFTTVGIPPFGEFPIRYELLSELSKLSLSIAMAVLVGMGGLFLTAMRVMVAFASNASAEWKIQEKPGEIALLAVAVVALILIGLFPHVFLSRLAVLLQAFTSLK